MLAIIKEHTMRILLISFVGWTVLFQFLVFFTRINVMKITVLVGTFALAMAFAGNDLVNFIGVPLAGFESFKAFMASGSRRSRRISDDRPAGNGKYSHLFPDCCRTDHGTDPSLFQESQISYSHHH